MVEIESPLGHFVQRDALAKDFVAGDPVVVGASLQSQFDAGIAHVLGLALADGVRRRRRLLVALAAGMQWEIEVNQFAGRHLVERDAALHQVGAAALLAPIRFVEGDDVVFLWQQAFRLDGDRAGRGPLGNDETALAVAAQTLEIHGRVVAGDQGSEDMHPTAHDALLVQVVVNVHQFTQSFELGGVRGVAGHVEIDAEQPTPGGFVVVVRVPDVGNVAGLIWREEQRGVVIAQGADRTVAERERRGVARVIIAAVVAAAVYGLERALRMLVEEGPDQAAEAFVLREHDTVVSLARRRKETVVAPLEVAPARDKLVELAFHKCHHFGS